MIPAQPSYPGYRSFDGPDDPESRLFFGRGEEDGEDREVGRLLQHVLEVRDFRFVAARGAAEIGKSSLVRAGLVRALSRRPEAWRWAILRPGENPTGNLIDALERREALGLRVARSPEDLLASGVGAIAPRVREPLLIVVDQFEELFRYRHCRRLLDTAQHDAAFVDLLVALATTDQAQIHVLVTMRSDFDKPCEKDYPRLLDNKYLVRPMQADHLRLAIDKAVPEWVSSELLGKVSGAFDPDRFPGHLPIIQHALRWAWDRLRLSSTELSAADWEELAPPDEEIDRQATLQSQADPAERQPDEAAGWLTDTPHLALKRHAEEIWHKQCDPAERKVASMLFRTIVAKRDSGFVRRPMSIGRIARLWQIDVGLVKRVVKRFQMPGQTFLMQPSTAEVSEDTIVDISYDSFVLVLGSKWEHPEYPLLYVKEPEEAADEAGGKKRLLLAFAALLPLPLLFLLTAFLSSWDHRNVEVDRECCQEVPNQFGDEFGDVIFGDWEVGDTHLTDEDVQEIRDEIGDGFGDVHLTQGDIERIQIAVGDRLFRVESPVAPVTRASTGPAIQHADHRKVRRGFVYAIEPGPRLPLPELGLELDLELELGDCGSDGSKYKLVVRRFGRPNGPALYPTPPDNTDCLLSPVYPEGEQDKPRDDPWSSADSAREAAFPDGAGFHYAIVVNRDESGRYAVVRRCATKCPPPPFETPE